MPLALPNREISSSHPEETKYPSNPAPIGSPRLFSKAFTKSIEARIGNSLQSILITGMSLISVRRLQLRSETYAAEATNLRRYFPFGPIYYCYPYCSCSSNGLLDRVRFERHLGRDERVIFRYSIRQTAVSVAAVRPASLMVAHS